MRFPLAVIAWLVTQTTTKAVEDLPQRAEEAGLLIQSVRLNKLETLIELVASKPRAEGV
jgi:demethylmenaquinone methyltransferase/2-methoxy-6-polyprenyl-1,4-benzoquinol methylase